MTQIESLVPELSILYLCSLYLFSKIILYLALKVLALTHCFKSVGKLFQCLGSFNDNVKRPSLSFAELYDNAIFVPCTIFGNGVV